MNRALFPGFALGLLLTACSSQSTAVPPAPPPAQPEVQPPVDQKVEPPADEQATGWDTLNFEKANYADSDLNSFGHYHTSWVSCTGSNLGTAADGVIRDGDLWQSLVKDMNAAIKLPRSKAMTCFAFLLLRPSRLTPGT